jgi:hypothetical protein
MEKKKIKVEYREKNALKRMLLIKVCLLRGFRGFVGFQVSSRELYVCSFVSLLVCLFVLSPVFFIRTIFFGDISLIFKSIISSSYYCQATLFPSALGPSWPAPCLNYFFFPSFFLSSLVVVVVVVIHVSVCLLACLCLCTCLLSFFISIFFLLNSFLCTYLSETYGLIHVSLFYQDISKVTCTCMDGYSELPGLLPLCGGIPSTGWVLA